MCHVLLAVSDKNIYARRPSISKNEHERQKKGLDASVFSSKGSVMLILVPKRSHQSYIIKTAY